MTMKHRARSIAELLAQDKRYKREAYAFVFEALRYAHDVLQMGKLSRSDAEEEKERSAQPQRHLSGQELCLAIRSYAMQQYGYMAKTVLNNWGVYKTGDFGEIVFNLIEVGEMRKTKEDRREDFDDVFDFDIDMRRAFRIEASE